MFEDLNNDNFMLYAAKNYENPHIVGSEEFFADLKRFNYIKRLFGKFERGEDLKERLLLNHIVILYNVFGEAATRMLFFKLDGFHHYLVPFLVLLRQLKREVVISKTRTIYTPSIRMSKEVIDKLRKI